MTDQQTPKIAIVHYWIMSWRSGERVLEALVKRFPDVDVYIHGRPWGVTASPSAEHRIPTTPIHLYSFTNIESSSI